MQDFFIRFRTFAVLGLSRKPKSFSRKVYAFLKDEGFILYPVNPHMEKIDDQEAFKDISSLPPVEAAIFFTNPRVTEKLLPLCKEKGILNVWFQLGSADANVLKLAHELGLHFKTSCVFLHRPRAGFPHNVHRFVVKKLGLDH
ncbi:CoA-binding protein [Natronospira sp.]|uniref:CoA-binding protein n=1 Tax=Natronospira sp. TaxID=2024970 RepID=UPI003872B571